MIVTVHVRPNAKKNEILAWLDDSTVKITVTAAPEKGKANEAVLKILSDHYNIPKTTIKLVHGATTRMKQFSVPDSAILR